MKRRLSDRVLSCWDKFYKTVNGILTILSYFVICADFGFVAYHLFVCYDISRVIAGCITLYAMIHLNKSV